MVLAGYSLSWSQIERIADLHLFIIVISPTFLAGTDRFSKAGDFHPAVNRLKISLFHLNCLPDRLNFLLRRS